MVDFPDSAAPKIKTFAFLCSVVSSNVDVVDGTDWTISWNQIYLISFDCKNSEINLMKDQERYYQN